jgi:hypothetical protein
MVSHNTPPHESEAARQNFLTYDVASDVYAGTSHHLATGIYQRSKITDGVV